MTAKKISELAAAGALAGTEVLPIVQSGATKKTTAQDIANLAPSDAADITYTPADATDWTSSTDPGNVDDALDQLADRLASLGTSSTLVSDTDGTLAANSDTRVATQKAVKTYVDQIVAAQDAMVFKGVVDCSTNPNYPGADRGHTYRVSVAGKIGGASGVNVEVGDLLLCLTDATATGDHATAGAAWSIAQVNLDGAVIGPASVTNEHVAVFDGTSGKLLKGSSITGILDFLGAGTQGSILFRDASTWERLNPGTAGEFLQTQGAAANPIWAAAGGGGGGGGGALEYLSSVSVSGSAATSMTISGLDIDTDGVYLLKYSIKNATGTNSGANVLFNGDTTAGNYTYSIVVSHGGGVSAGTGTGKTGLSMLGSREGVGLVLIFRTINGYIRAIMIRATGAGTSAHELHLLSYVWATSANLTSLLLECDVANALAVGSKADIYRVTT